MTPDQLRAALHQLRGEGWLDDARERVSARPSEAAVLFAAAGRRCGWAELPDAPGWTAADAARAVLLAALPADDLPAAIADLYRYGDAAEKQAVLRVLPMLPVGDAGVPLLHDAIRTNDTRLLAAALGPYALRLTDDAWRQAVLKCVFTGVPLAAVHGLEQRADGELAGMLRRLAEERHAAGRELPADAADLLHRLDPATAQWPDAQPASVPSFPREA